jgi:septum formation protein
LSARPKQTKSLPPLILASSSRYRAELLGRLRIPFTSEASEVDETPQAYEAPASLAQRLALAKAQAVAGKHPEAIVLGSDQVATFDGRPLGKPGSRAAAIAQLQAQSGRSVDFLTAVVLLRADAEPVTHLDRTVVCFRKLDNAEIERYVDAEPAFDCAGSFKCEGLGITLLSSVETDDPTALVGLPLIAVRWLLAEAGVRLP